MSAAARTTAASLTASERRDRRYATTAFCWTLACLAGIIAGVVYGSTGDTDVTWAAMGLMGFSLLIVAGRMLDVRISGNDRTWSSSMRRDLRWMATMSFIGVACCGITLLVS